jgi:serine/threonine protein kinase
MAKFFDTLETPPYARVRALGCGPYSVVDEVRNLATGAIFARKTITYPNQRESASFLTEIEIMKKLDHPHIVRFVDTYTLDKSVSILMSPVADFDLGYFMSKYQTVELMPMDSVIQWFSCLVSSVEYLHEKSIKHQDIKPSNILIKGQTIFLADFGIAKTFVDSDSTGSTTGDMTRKYCSPETAQHGLRGRKADVFSLGCVFLEMLSFLICQRHSEFGQYQELHFNGDGTYQENLPMVKLWIEGLRREPSVERSPMLRQLLDSCEAMLQRTSENRPSAADLSAALSSGECCFPTENASVSQSALEQRQVAALETAIPSSSVTNAKGAKLDKFVHVWFENTVGQISLFS